MSETPLVSIITPSYNQAAFLEHTLNSVFLQTYPNLEYLVVDGASTDGSVEIIRRNAGRLAYWVSEKDQGQAEAINKGFQRARGEIIAWLNSDDIYLPGAITQAVHALQTHPQAGLVFGDAITMDAQGRPLNQLSFGDWGLDELMRFRIICQPAVFMRRSVLEKAGYLDRSFHFLLDHHLWIRMASAAPVQHIPEIWAAARHHAQAKNVAQAAGFGQEARRILSWMYDQPQLLPATITNKRQILAGVYRLEGRYLLDGGQPAAALSAYFRSFINKPGYALQHSHRMLYALLSLVKANQLADRLRAAKITQQRNQLISELQNKFAKIAGKDTPMPWPGLDLRFLT